MLKSSEKRKRKLYNFEYSVLGTCLEEPQNKQRPGSMQQFSLLKVKYKGWSPTDLDLNLDSQANYLTTLNLNIPSGSREIK